MSEEIRVLFERAAAAKAVGDLDTVDDVFLATVRFGIPDGVRVLYLYDQEVGRPSRFEEYYVLDLFVLEFDGEQGQVMPAHILDGWDPQLAVSLFAAAEFRQLEEQDDDDWDAEDGSSWGGDESPPGYLDVVDWGHDDLDDWEDDDD